jgi:hypothetical protein
MKGKPLMLAFGFEPEQLTCASILIHPVQTHHPIGIKIHDVPGPGEFLAGVEADGIVLQNRNGNL